MKKLNKNESEFSIEKYKTEEGEVKEYKEFFVELDAVELQFICKMFCHMTEERRDYLMEKYETELGNIYSKLRNFDNHYDQDKTYIQLYTG
jgi:hypothetical protein